MCPPMNILLVLLHPKTPPTKTFQLLIDVLFIYCDLSELYSKQTEYSLAILQSTYTV